MLPPRRVRKRELSQRIRCRACSGRDRRLQTGSRAARSVRKGFPADGLWMRDDRVEWLELTMTSAACGGGARERRARSRGARRARVHSVERYMVGRWHTGAPDDRRCEMRYVERAARRARLEDRTALSDALRGAPAQGVENVLSSYMCYMTQHTTHYRRESGPCTCAGPCMARSGA